MAGELADAVYDSNQVLCACGRLLHAFPGDAHFSGCMFRNCSLILPDGTTLPAPRCAACELLHGDVWVACLCDCGQEQESESQRCPRCGQLVGEGLVFCTCGKQ